MGQIAHQSSLRPDHDGTFTKGELEKARAEDEERQKEIAEQKKLRDQDLLPIIKQD